ncbi:hypothetical protein LPB140_00120 [Sphingorhabdus lutea]|uniref:ABC3 transporter permease C-terminal domain-containing protein n=1 Tax=Sphingorhabdus lutea TaxID=1913578 RepID=A0A1L3J8Q1_9SPHN|nr:FtsX-like permease family protein [Sphingorhabdus lutea]APG61507.1 hypothetical protein LPB140_00120 [Sphingorhabdus lutea]
MMNFWNIPAHHRNLIPEGRFNGPMPWVIAIMMFLATLAIGSALALGNLAMESRAKISKQISIQILESNEQLRAQQAEQILNILKKRSDIVTAAIVPAQDVEEVVAPWLGDSLTGSELYLPTLIEAETYEDFNQIELNQLKSQLRDAAPQMSLESQAEWLKPLFTFTQSMTLLAIFLVFLLAAATSATIALTVRSALNTHWATIEIMHQMGSSDQQIARLFQRRIALDALLGSVVGVIFGAVIIIIFDWQFSKMAVGIFSQSQFPLYGWLIIALVPLLAMFLSWLMARFTARRALRKML